MKFALGFTLRVTLDPKVGAMNSDAQAQFEAFFQFFLLLLLFAQFFLVIVEVWKQQNKYFESPFQLFLKRFSVRRFFWGRCDEEK